MEQGLEGLRPPRSPDDALNFHGAIFDVDGTLVDSNDAHAHAFVEAFSERGLDVPFDKVRRLIGKGSDKLIPELIGRYDPAIADRKKAIFKARYLPVLRAFPKVEALLERLRASAVKLAVASSAGETSSQRCSTLPLALAPLRCVMIGDTPYDAKAARGAGVAFIGRALRRMGRRAPAARARRLRGSGRSS